MKTAELGDVATIERQGVDPTALLPDTPYLGLEHIQRGGQIIGHGTVAGAELTSTKFRFSPEHILFGKLRPNLGKISRPEFAGVCSTDILPIRPGKDVDRNYLAHYLAQPSMVDFAASRTSGANLPRLSPTVLAKFSIPLPPLDEQRRIAAILDQADALRAKRRQILAHLDALTQSIFHDMFGEPREWPKRWRMGTIGDLAVRVDYGTSARAGTAGTWPILRMGNVTDDGRLDLSDLKYVDLSASEVSKYTVQTGDMLFNRTNSKEKVGKSAVVRTSQRFAIAGYLIRVRFKDAATAEYVSAYLASQHGVAVRRRLAKAAVNQANINATEMRSIAVALPPEELKRTFHAALRATDAHRAAELRGLTSDDELLASLQSRAFRGEL